MKQRKNILISALSLGIGGAEVLAMSLAAELSKRHNVFLFYHLEGEVNEEMVKRVIPPEVTLLSMKTIPALNFIAWKTNALAAKIFGAASVHDFVRRQLFSYYVSKYKIDIINSHSKYSDLVCVPVAAEKNIPLVITENGEYTQAIAAGDTSFLPLIEKAAAFVTASDYNKKAVLGVAPAFKPPVTTILNGVNIKVKNYQPSARQQLQIPNDGFVFGMVSRGIKEKGWQQAIDAFLVAQQQTDKKIYLLLVGGSPYLTSLAAKYSPHTNIIFTGASPEPAFYIDGFDVGLLPSYFKAESMPLAVIEYLFYQKPVIASHIGGLAEIVVYQGKEMGLLVNRTPEGPANVLLLTAAMLTYVTNTELYKTHAENAAVTRDRFNLQTCTAQYEQVYQQAMAQ